MKAPDLVVPFSFIERRLKVYGCWRSKKRVPEIRLSGKWLFEFGVKEGISFIVRRTEKGITLEFYK